MSINGPIPKAQFSLYDMISPAPGTRSFGEFTTLTGGDQKISLVTYNVISPEGGVTTRSMPGQTTFEPIQLLRPMDAYAEQVYKKLRAAISGELKDLRRDYSVSMNDEVGNPLVIWNLYNAVPSMLDGFMFNMTTENNYTDFEISIIAEDIELIFL